MICRQCGTEIAVKALVCYRCGTATTEAKFEAPLPASGPRASRARMALGIVVLIAALAIVLYFIR